MKRTIKSDNHHLLTLICSLVILFGCLLTCNAKDYGPFGGGGMPAAFDARVPAGCRVIGINIWSGDFVDAIQIVYVDAAGQAQQTAKVGGPGGDYHYLDAVQHPLLRAVTYGSWLNQLLFQGVTYGNVPGPSTGLGDIPVAQITEVSGHAGKFIDNITFRTQP